MFRLAGYYVSNNRASKESLKKYNDNIDILLPTWLEVKEDGSLLEKNSVEEENFLKKHVNKESIIPVVQNFQMNSEVSNTLVNNEESCNNFANNLKKFSEKYGYKSLNINIEGVKKQFKNNLNDFIRKLSRCFHSNNQYMGMSIPAKNEDNNSVWAGAYDYSFLGQFADYITIMAYDYHWVKGPPGPVAPLPWVQDVIDYAIMKVSSQKIYLGIPCYGYDWAVTKPNRPAKGLSYHQVMQIKEKYDASIEWDQESQTPYMKYQDTEGEHELWFENKLSILKKIKMAQDFQLGGATLWRVGLEDPALWSNLN